MITKSIPTSQFDGLDLRDGDDIRGTVSGNTVEITVLNREPCRRASKASFANRWFGKFSNQKGALATDDDPDPRSEYLLNR